jgi:uncharacterized protein YjbJ (UPF0337 family)
MSFENAKDEFEGKAKETIGKATGDSETQGEGFGQKLKAQAEGLGEKASEGFKDAKEKVEGVFNGLKGDKGDT